MATLTSISESTPCVTESNFLDSVLPTYGNKRVHTPAWDESQKMFICSEYESEKGYRYLVGVRFCDRIAIVEKIAMVYSWTYVNDVELYAFNGQSMELIQKKDYGIKVFKDEAMIRRDSEEMVKSFIKGALKVNRCVMSEDQIAEQAHSLVSKCYKSFLDDDFNFRLTQIIPQLEQA